MPVMDVVLFLAGLAALLAGGDGLVRGAAATARSLGVSSLVVGLTVVSFGTSAPELAVSMTSGMSSYADLALGNVVGSNIFNVLLVLGMAACVRPLVVQKQLASFDVPVMTAVTLLLVLLSLPGSVGGLSGLLLTSILAAWLFWTVRSARRPAHGHASLPRAPTDPAAMVALGGPLDQAGEATADDDEEDAEVEIAAEVEEVQQVSKGEIALVVVAAALLAFAAFKGHLSGWMGWALVAALVANPLVGLAGRRDRAPLALHLIQVGLGIGIIVAAADCLVTGAVGVARWMGASDAVIGLTVVAAGTSLPEAVTSVVASARGETDLAVGNVVGSNIFNVLCIVGLTAMLVDLPVARELMQFDYAALLGITIGLWLLVRRGRDITRLHGALMLACFVGYLVVQVMRVG